MPRVEAGSLCEGLDLAEHGGLEGGRTRSPHGVRPCRGERAEIAAALRRGVECGNEPVEVARARCGIDARIAVPEVLAALLDGLREVARR
ncbi:MAG: hypothetical protein U0360_07385 [Dehalococcoidia bacterium]